MNDSIRPGDALGGTTEPERKPPNDDVDRTQSTVIAPRSVRARTPSPDPEGEGPRSVSPSSTTGQKKRDSTASARFPPPSSAPRSYRSNPPSGSGSGSGPTRQPGSLRSRAFPVQNWDRYEPVDFIGEGGMGRVYKVLDPVLKRHIALKFIRDEDDRLIRRFFQEAQAQARINHEYVCKVYEVGEVEGLPYIAMQFIDGKSLKEMSHILTVEQKVTLVRKVALALHAAHKMGIIHRDIKPSNIMVEQKDDGSYHPYVMDFGLAREMASPGESVTGLIEGTPSYMAPEQARGETSHIDRRVDVYSLGATLYQQLADRPPFTGDSTLSVLLALEKEEATPLREIVRSTPEDLEIIVMKCLEKEAYRRYDSARAFAEDLGRYLEGDPIAARKASLGYLLLKSIRKHKALFAVSCAGALGVAVAAGFGVRARMLAAEQAELSKQVGEDVKEMELLMRWAYGLPLHDVGREKARIRDRMKEIEARIDRMGELGAGPGHYALGRGHLALREPERARDHLTKALAAGYDGADVERALGTALGELYKKELEETYRIGDKKPREERRAVIEKDLLQPALSHLRKGADEGIESEALMEGLIAFYQKQYHVALEKSRLSEERALSTYEAKKLRADVYSALGTEKKEKGETDGALADYDRAAEAYEAARTIARSDASVYEAECELWAERMEIELNSRKSPKASFDKAQAACDGALTANPESGSAHGRKAWALWKLGHYFLRTGQDPTSLLTQAIQVGEAAIRIDPNNANNHDTIGNSYTMLGFYEKSHQKEPRKSFQLAIKNLEDAIALHPNFAWGYNDLGIVNNALGEFESSRGVDPSEPLRKSVEHFKKAIELDVSYYYPYTNMGVAYSARVDYDLRFGRDPSDAIKAWIDICERSLSVNKSYSNTHGILGSAYLLDAEYKFYRSEPFDQSLKLALQWFDSELSLDSESSDAHLGVATAHMLAARDALLRGEDPAIALQKAESAVQKAEKTGGDDPHVMLGRVDLLILKARVIAKSSKTAKDVVAAYKEADEAFSAAKKAGAGLWEVAATGAALSFWSARESLQNKEPAEDAIRRGVALVDEGLTISSAEPTLLAWKGALLLLLGRSSKGPVADEALRNGRNLLDGALRKNRYLEREWKVIDRATDTN